MKGLKILIVEDEFIIANNLKGILEDLGYTPLKPCLTKEQAVSSIEEFWPDLVLLDINLNGKYEGLEIGEYLSKEAHIPFIYITGNSDKATVEAAKQTNPLAYIIKPFRPPLKTLFC